MQKEVETYFVAYKIKNTPEENTKQIEQRYGSLKILPHLGIIKPPKKYDSVFFKKDNLERVLKNEGYHKELVNELKQKTKLGASWIDLVISEIINLEEFQNWYTILKIEYANKLTYLNLEEYSKGR